MLTFITAEYGENDTCRGIVIGFFFQSLSKNNLILGKNEDAKVCPMTIP
jgi:hypothetical protein